MANNTSSQVLLPAPSCLSLPDPLFHAVSKRYSVNLVTAIINILTAPFAVIPNLLIFVAIITGPRTPCNLLITCLALCDLFVGLAVQPRYITYPLMENQLRPVPCFVRVVYTTAFYVCFGVALITLAAVSYERLVAVRLQVKYNEVFSSKRVLKYMAAIWILNIILTGLMWARIYRISRAAHLTVWFICLVASLAANIRIIFNLRRHHRKLKSHNTIPENIRRHRELKLTANVLFIVGIYLLLNLPELFVAIYHQVSEQDIMTYNHYSWTETLAFLNSCTNPLTCCWKSQRIRHGVQAILKRITSRSVHSEEKKHRGVTWYAVYKMIQEKGP